MTKKSQYVSRNTLNANKEENAEVYIYTRVKNRIIYLEARDKEYLLIIQIPLDLDKMAIT